MELFGDPDGGKKPANSNFVLQHRNFPRSVRFAFFFGSVVFLFLGCNIAWSRLFDVVVDGDEKSELSSSLSCFQLAYSSITLEFTKSKSKTSDVR